MGIRNVTNVFNKVREYPCHKHTITIVILINRGRSINYLSITVDHRVLPIVGKIKVEAFEFMKFPTFPPF
jgi:hypothetical protein